MVGTLYLIPVTLGETALDRVVPAYNSRIIDTIDHFIVEDIRSARRFLRKSNPEKEIDTLTFYELNKHTDPKQLSTYLSAIDRGQNIGIISEAGCPAIADPGADIVALAQQKGYKVIPLVGPSSILMSLMASGFNGQGFSFHGYLPIEPSERTKTIKQLEQRIYSDDQTQLFIETPYRNDKMVEDILKTCRPQTKLCIAANITCEDELIQTRSIAEWKKRVPQIGKMPCIFLLYR